MSSALVVTLVLGGWGAEVPMGPAGSPVPAWGGRFHPTTAAQGDDFLVAWQDGRFGGLPGIMLSRRLADGGVQPPFGVLASELNAKNPRLAANDAVALVTWEQDARTWLRPRQGNQWLASPTSLADGRCPDVALGPNGGIVVFEDGPIRALRLSPSGQVLDMSPLDISDVTLPWGACARATVDANGDSLVVWLEGGNLLARRVPASGPVTAVGFLVDVGTAPSAPMLEVTSLGPAHFHVVAGWPVAGNMTRLTAYDIGNTSLWSAPLLPDGDWCGVDSATCGDNLCVLGRNGTTSLTLTWASVPLDAGATIPGPVFPTSTNSWDLGANPDGSVLLAVSLAQNQVNAQLVSTAPAFPLLGPPAVLSVAPPGQLGPRAAAFTDDLLVAWIRPTSATTSEVFIRRFDRFGMPMDAQPVRIGGALPHYDLVEVHPTATGWVVVLLDSWSEQVAVQSVSPTGQVGPERQSNVTAADIGVAVEGERVLIAMKHYQGTTWDPYLTTLEPDGGETALRLQDTLSKEHGPDVAISGTGERLAVFQDVDPSATTDGIVAGVRVSSSGQPLDSAGFRISPPGGPEALNPEVVGDGDAGFFVVWQSYKLLYAQHVVGTAAGAPLAFAEMTAQGAPLTQHQLIATPRGALVVYANQVDGGVSAQELSVGPLGLAAGPPVALSTGSFNAWPTLALSTETGWATFSLAEPTESTMLGRVRPFAREGLGGACVAHWQCLSFACASGICAAAVVADGGTGGGAAGGGAGGTGGGSGGGAAGGSGGSSTGGGSGGPGEYRVGCSCTVLEPGGALLLLAFAFTLRPRRRG